MLKIFRSMVPEIKVDYYKGRKQDACNAICCCEGKRHPADIIMFDNQMLVN